MWTRSSSRLVASGLAVGSVFEDLLVRKVVGVVGLSYEAGGMVRSDDRSAWRPAARTFWWYDEEGPQWV
jgi:hypothetical protein